jgi:hypothetical protein
MKIRFLLALVGLTISFALPIFAQQKETVDPQLQRALVALVNKHADAINKAPSPRCSRRTRFP